LLERGLGKWLLVGRGEGFVKGGDETSIVQGSEKWGVKCSEVKCCGVK
jgi:hypothetical protein